MYSLPKEELNASHTISAVQYVADLMLTRRMDDWPIGPRQARHRELALYQERVFGRAARASAAPVGPIRRLPASPLGEANDGDGDRQIPIL